MAQHCTLFLGDNDFDMIDDTDEFYRDVTFTIMNTGRTLLTYGIRPFFIPLQNRRRPRRDNYNDLRTQTNYQLADHFSRSFGYPAMVETLGYTNRTLCEDGIHFTERDYLEAAREINLHLDRYRLRPFDVQRPLIRHETYLATLADFEEEMELRNMGDVDGDGRAEVIELEQGAVGGVTEVGEVKMITLGLDNTVDAVNELVEGARLLGERAEVGGVVEDGEVEMVTLGQDNTVDAVNELVEEARLLGERSADIEGNSAETISLAEEARLLGEEPTAGVAEGAVGWAGDSGEDGANGQVAGLGFRLVQDTHGRGSQEEQTNTGTQVRDTDNSSSKADLNNNDSQELGRGRRPRTRAYRRPDSDPTRPGLVSVRPEIVYIMFGRA